MFEIQCALVDLILKKKNHREIVKYLTIQSVEVDLYTIEDAIGRTLL